MEATKPLRILDEFSVIATFLMDLKSLHLISAAWYCPLNGSAWGGTETLWGLQMSVSKALLVFAAAAFASSAAFAGHNGSPIKQIVQPSFALHLKNEAFVQGNGDSTALSQFNYTPIDSGTTLKCTRTCTLVASVTQQVNTGGADWAICIAVDGAYAECQYQGVQSGPSSFVVGNVITSAPSLAIGNHTVQTFVYTESASSTYQYYSMNYSVHQ